MYQPNLPLEAGRYVTASKEHIALSLEAATEGMVLLKNENNILPLKNGSRITLFGRGSFDYVKGGGGSGDVTVSYVHNLYDGFKTLEDKVQVYEPVAEFYKKNVEEQYAIGYDRRAGTAAGTSGRRESIWRYRTYRTESFLRRGMGSFQRGIQR